MDKLLGVVAIIFLITISATPTSNSLYAISSSSCQPCVERIRTVKQMYPNSTFVTYDIAEPLNVKRFSGIAAVINITYIPLPVIGVFTNDKLKLVAAGGISKKAWEGIVTDEGPGLNVYVDNGQGDAILKKTIVDNGSISKLEMLFQSKDLSEVPEAVEISLPILITSAFLDSLNICMLGFFLVFLSYISISLSNSAAIRISLSFIVGAFLVRLVTGFVLIQIFWITPSIRILATVLVFVFGIIKISQFFSGERRAIPSRFADEINKRIEDASNPRTGFVAGCLTAFFITTCSSPTYSMAISLISSGSNVIWGLVSVVIYNIVILIPMFAILICIFILNLTTTHKLRDLVSSNRRYLNLITGLALVLMSILFLYQTVFLN
jgi:cytochrome c biogenesis protein CcdA